MSLTAKVLVALSLLIGTGTNTATQTKVTPPPNATQHKIVQPVKIKENGQVVNINTDLMVREKPNMNSKVSKKLKNGMTIKLKEKNGEWYTVQYNNEKGYVSSKYIVEYDKKPPNPLYKKPVINIGKEKSNKDNERSNNISSTLSAQLTAYDNSQESSGNWGSLTAMGTHTRRGVIAAPKDIPLGTKIYIPSLKWYKSDGIFTVEDRGGAVVVKPNGDYVIDVWFADGTDLDKFGRQYTKIFILKNKKTF